MRAASSSSFLVLSQVMDRDVLKPTKKPTFYLLLGRQICKISEFKLLRKDARSLIKQISIKKRGMCFIQSLFCM